MLKQKVMSLSDGVCLQVKEVELISLLDITRAINANKNEEDLYKMYKFTTRSHPAIIKMALYVLDQGKWNYKVSFGTQKDYSKIILPKEMLDNRKEKEHKVPIKPFDEFQLVIPIKYKKDIYAYLFTSPNDFYSARGDLPDLNFIQALTNIIIAAIENKKLALREKRQLEYKRQLELAAEVQRLLFPRNLPYNKEIKITASYFPHHNVGGDYYDYIRINRHESLLCIADVSGKGIPAALIMSNFQASLRLLAAKVNSLKHIVHELNRLVAANAHGEHFITAFLLKFNSVSREIEYVNAGHIPPFFFFGNEILSLEKGTTIIGAFQDLPFLDVGRLENISSCFFFSCTDGLTETYNTEGVQFGEKRLHQLLQDNIALDIKLLHEKIIQALKDFKAINDFNDDITLLSFRVGDNT